MNKADRWFATQVDNRRNTPQWRSKSFSTAAELVFRGSGFAPAVLLSSDSMLLPPADALSLAAWLLDLFQETGDADNG